MVDRDSWQQANQRYVTASLAVLTDTIERRLARPKNANGGAPGAGAPGGPADGPPGNASAETVAALQAAERALPSEAALQRVCRVFSLSAFERDLLLLAAGVELSSAFVQLVARALGDTRVTRPTFGLALSLLPDAHWSAIAPHGPLRRWRLIEIGPSELVTESALRLDEAILHYLAGLGYDDERTHLVLRPVEPPSGPLCGEHAALARAAARDLVTDDTVVLRVSGPHIEEQRAVAAAASAMLARTVYAVAASDIPATPSDREHLARLCERHCALTDALLLIDASHAAEQDRARVSAFVRVLAAPVWVAGDEALAVEGRPNRRIHVPPMSSEQQRAAWREALGAAPAELTSEIDALVAEFSLPASRIRQVAARAGAVVAGAGAAGGVVWDTAREEVSTRLGELARRIETRATFDDLVLPATQLQTLKDILIHARQRHTVFEKWGFAHKSHRGLGLSVLFAGQSGTGKTMAAEVLANELRLDLFHIDLSQVVSKFIGETEKNLRRLFDAAEGGGAILLFDEADSLFGKRSEVKDSHDRYANLEVSYLLQRMEAFRGLAVLTTNMKNSLDTAFLRRLRFIVPFPFPELTQRAEIWRRTFPKDAPLDPGVDVDRLARLNVAGGTIRSIALNAAFLAADGGEAIGMTHLARAARVEFAKMEKPLPAGELGAFA